MNDANRTLCCLADLLNYPSSSYRERIRELVQAIEGDAQLASPLERFASSVDTLELCQIEELFTRTFDLNSSTCLEVGWHLFGEDYKRGEFLVRMRQALAQFGLPESVELPDHMSHCLGLLERLDPEDGRVFTVVYLFPAIEKILGRFPEENPFKPLIEFLQGVLERRFPGALEEAGRQNRRGYAEQELVQLQGTHAEPICGGPVRERDLPFQG